MGFPGGMVVKNLLINAADVGNVGSILILGRSLAVEMITHSSILAWRGPWTEEPGGLHLSHKMSVATEKVPACE